MWYILSLFNKHIYNRWYPFLAYSVTVGMQQTAYTVGEVDGYQLVCFELVSGDLAGRELTFDYSTTSGTASN